jgi:hypothetical protein
MMIDRSARIAHQPDVLAYYTHPDLPTMTGFMILVTVVFLTLAGQAAEKPNIVYILCDDLGYGDLRCLNRDSKIATPNFDSIAAAGMAFADARSGSAVCSPTLYGILTGRYAWHTRLQTASWAD